MVGDDAPGFRSELAAAQAKRGAGMSSVVVTGAAKGIGAAIAEAFARAGWSVVAVDRDETALQTMAALVDRKVVTLARDGAQRATDDAAVENPVRRLCRVHAPV